MASRRFENSSLDGYVPLSLNNLINVTDLLEPKLYVPTRVLFFFIHILVSAEGEIQSLHGKNFGFIPFSGCCPTISYTVPCQTLLG